MKNKFFTRQICACGPKFAGYEKGMVIKMNENRVNRTSFMKQWDFAKVLTPINLSDTSYPVGGMPLMVDGQTAYIDESDNHALIFGATGSRKTRTLIMPTLEILCRAGESFVVTDPKGELFKRTAKLAGDREYDVVCNDLREIELSDAWNPLLVPYDLYHSGYTFQAMTMISDFAQMLSSVMSDEKDKFWSVSGQDFIMGLVLILMERADRQQCNVGTLISLWREYKNEKEAFIKKVKKEFTNTLVEIKLENIVCSSDKTLGSIEAIVSFLSGNAGTEAAAKQI